MFEASNRGLNTQGCWNWQTSRPQTPVFLTCGFKSRPLHQKILGLVRGFFYLFTLHFISHNGKHKRARNSLCTANLITMIVALTVKY